jgi:hypothetical protein
MTPEPEVHFEWKPMNFTLNPLDSQIQKQEVEKPIPIEIKVEVNPIEEAKVEEAKPEIKIESVVEEVVKAEEKVVEIISENLLTQQLDAVESNVPDFVNTWQSWLKIDREVKPKEEAVQVEKTIEKKSEIIDRFIEDNPRISQLKEESQYVVKEKKADISHLMTETLAKLYVEQKLYSKAIKAYEVLKKKHPEKSEYFNIKIQEIKELKQNK